MTAPLRTVALLTLGCARNEVDSEELAGRLAADGWQLVADPDAADVAVVNTCGFVDAAKKDSVDAILDLAGPGRPVVAVGCLAERYGVELASALPEAAAVLGFDSYQDISSRLAAVLAGAPPASHVPVDRRRLLPIAPAERARSASGVGTLSAPRDATSPAGSSSPSSPSLRGARRRAEADQAGHRAGPASGPRPVRARLDDSPVAPLKIASGCDRRCAFCAIPSFRGAFLSRPPEEVLAEAGWLAGQGVRELLLVSENSTSYGKDLGDLRSLEALLPRLAAVPGIRRVRVSYLQPAEMRPSLVAAIAGSPGVAAYFDLPFQHASARLLRRMRRFGGTERFLDLLASVRAAAPDAGVRANVIVGFPGETEDDLAELEHFLTGARLDAVGVFGYSDEAGTEGATLEGKLDEVEIRSRVERVTSLVDELVVQRAEDRVGEIVEVLVESAGPAASEGRAACQGPEDGTTLLRGARLRVGDLVTAQVVGTDGVDLLAEPVAA